MRKEETKLMLDRIAQRHDLRVIDTDYVQKQQALIDDLKMVIQMAYWHNINASQLYNVVARQLYQENSMDCLEFAAKGLGLIEANDNILQELNRHNLKDVLVMPKNNGRSEMKKHLRNVWM